MKYLLPAIVVSIFLFSFSVAGFAATFTVNKTADTNDGTCDADCSLREAIDAANVAATDDAIEFDAGVFGFAQTITLANGELSIANNGTLLINGPGRALLTISGNSLSRVFSIDVGAAAAISSVTVSDGNSMGDRGAGILNLGTLSVGDTTVQNNTTTGNGGGIFNDGNQSDLFISDSLVINNSGNGGGIYNFNGTATATNTIVNDNIASNGGGLLNVGGTFTVTDSQVNSNTANGGGTGAGIFNTGSIVMMNSSVDGNDGTTDGGGIRNDGGTLEITDSTISGNTSNRDGGAISNRFGMITLTRVTISGNEACTSCRGGGIASFANSSQGSQIDIVDSTLSGNIAAVGGGFESQRTTYNVIRSTISDNVVSAGGGGIIVTGGTTTLTNVTVSGNTATGTTSSGGGIILGSAILNLESTTVANNSSGSFGGGGIINGNGTSNGTLNSKNSIIADNSSTSGVNNDLLGNFESQGYNLIEDVSGANITGVTTGNIVGFDPFLLPLRNYGGITKSHALHPSSRAIDGANPADFPAIDQRGTARPQDGNLDTVSDPDIGSYEREVFSFTVTKTADTNDGVCDSDCSLREAVFAAVVSPTFDNAVVFDESVFTVEGTLTLTLGQLNTSNGGTMDIRGPESALQTISGNNASRVFLIGQQSAVAISNLKVVDGNGMSTGNSGFGGGINNDYGFLSLTNTIVSNNAAANGGGVSSMKGKLVIQDSRIENNDAGINAGGIFNQNISDLFIYDSSVSGNTSANTGGVDNRGNLEVHRSNIASNTCSNGTGGGVTNFNTGVAVIRDTNIFGNQLNSTFGDGGGIYNFGTMTLESSSVFDNSAGTSSSNGGGIYNSSVITIKNSTISGNRANEAGGVHVTVGSADIINSTITRNRINNNSDAGGVGDTGSSTVTIANTIIADNLLDNGGPAVDLEGTFASQGHNLLQNTGSATITGDTSTNIVGQDPKLLRLGNYGGLTKSHLPSTASPVIDAGDSPEDSADQRGAPRPFDFVSIPNIGDGSDMGAVERQESDPTGFAKFDFDGDGRTDVSIFRPGPGEWWYLRSSDGGNAAFQFGSTTDMIVPADYTGDGKTDIAFFRPSSSEWFILRSEDGSFYSFPFGASGDIPAPGDFDGDGIADPTVFRPSTATWFTLRSSDGGFTIQTFGAPGDQPTVEDFDGDGKDDIAIYRPSVSEWWQLRSTDGVVALQFGSAGDQTVPADYTGDGKADIAFWRPSNGFWFVLRSEDNSFFAFPFGASGDIPAPGDYDGDGTADATVFRPSATTWFSNQSTNGVQITGFGVTGDVPVPNAYVVE